MFFYLPTLAGALTIFLPDKTRTCIRRSFKKKTGRDKSISEGFKRTSLVPGRGGSMKRFVLKLPQTGISPGNFSPDKKKHFKLFPTVAKALAKK